jgi:hypothetical protein
LNALTACAFHSLKKDNEKFFNEHIVDGKLKLQDYVLIVDEVDDLVVNETPTKPYLKKDDELTPDYKQAYAALKAQGSKPEGVNPKVWESALKTKGEAEAKEKEIDFTIQGNVFYMLENGKLPKVPLTSDWLIYKNFETLKHVI